MAQMLAQMLLKFTNCLPEWQPLAHVEAMELNLGWAGRSVWDTEAEPRGATQHSEYQAPPPPPPPQTLVQNSRLTFSPHVY